MILMMILICNVLLRTLGKVIYLGNFKRAMAHLLGCCKKIGPIKRLSQFLEFLQYDNECKRESKIFQNQNGICRFQSLISAFLWCCLYFTLSLNFTIIF